MCVCVGGGVLIILYIKGGWWFLFTSLPPVYRILLTISSSAEPDAFQFAKWITRNRKIRPAMYNGYYVMSRHRYI